MLVDVTVGEAVDVGVRVEVAVGDAVALGVDVAVEVGVAEGVNVAVLVGVDVGVGVTVAGARSTNAKSPSVAVLPQNAPLSVTCSSVSVQDVPSRRRSAGGFTN